MGELPLDDTPIRSISLKNLDSDEACRVLAAAKDKTKVIFCRKTDRRSGQVTQDLFSLSGLSFEDQTVEKTILAAITKQEEAVEITVTVMTKDIIAS